MTDEERLARLQITERQFREIMRSLAFGLGERKDADVERLFGVHSKPPAETRPMSLWNALKAVW